MTVKDGALERERDWREYALPASFLVDFVLTAVSQNSLNGLAPSELFSADALKAFLDYSAKSISAYRRGMSFESIGSPRVSRPVDEGKTLESLFKTWNEAGWVSIDTREDGGVAISLSTN